MVDPLLVSQQNTRRLLGEANQLQLQLDHAMVDLDHAALDDDMDSIASDEEDDSAHASQLQTSIDQARAEVKTLAEQVQICLGNMDKTKYLVWLDKPKAVVQTESVRVAQTLTRVDLKRRGLDAAVRLCKSAGRVSGNVGQIDGLPPHELVSLKVSQASSICKRTTVYLSH